MNNRIAWLREHYSDPLLTALTVLVMVMLFVIAPLQASGLFLFQAFELAFAIVLVAGVFVMSGSRIAAFAMLASLVMATIGGIHRITAPSALDINLFAGSWLIMSITLGWAVAGVVFPFTSTAGCMTGRPRGNRAGASIRRCVSPSAPSCTCARPSG